MNAKYACLVWIKNQSGNFDADITSISKAGNRYLKYYLIKAANSVKNHIPAYKDFYLKKLRLNLINIKEHSHSHLVN